MTTLMRMHRWAGTALTCFALTGIPAGPAVAVDHVDNAFLRASHQSNLAEIALSQDAKKNATTSCVKEVAAKLEADHRKLDADTKALSDKLGVDLPVAPTAEQQQTLADVMAKAKTPAYDAAWLKTQEAAHEKSLARIDGQIAEGRNAEITAAAKAARPVVAGHLEMVRGGTCHAGSTGIGTGTTGTTPKRIHTGNGGQAELAADVPVFVTVPAVALGGVLVAAGAFWAAGRIRRNDPR
ncbi:DUF4142 domain-containing protein [Streptomyces coeruleoprunus]|uniref:DUF4142 domain-containing protein n=1 Tax=Streptomyces coeruleoprunus TaxID=285563 RepID=A0ABV9X9M1_9ACTN